MEQFNHRKNYKPIIDSKLLKSKYNKNNISAQISQTPSLPLELELNNKFKSIIEQGNQIHNKYLTQLRPYNLPTKLMDLAISSKQKHTQDLKIQAKQKKNQKNVILPAIDIKQAQSIAPWINPLIQKYANMLQNKALKINNTSDKKTVDDLLIESYNIFLKKAIHFHNKNANIFKSTHKSKQNLKKNQTDLLQKNKINMTQKKPLDIVLYNYKPRARFKNSKTRKARKKRKYKPVFSVFKKSIDISYQNKLKYIESKINKKTIIQPIKPTKKTTPVFKPKPLLPWIAEGRRKYKQIKKALSKLKLKLEFIPWRIGSVGILTRQHKKMIKKFRKNRKFGKFARYGKYSKFARKFMHKKPTEIVKHKIKRQSLYLQHKRLHKISNLNVLPQKYMYMLIIIWYLLMNTSLRLYQIILKREIWVNLFVKNLWISKAEYQINNFYLNYGINHGIAALITNINLYNPSRNGFYYELQALNSYQRLTINSFFKRQTLNKNTQSFFKPKRKSKVRTFFRISSTLKINTNHISKKRFGKHIKNNRSKRLEDNEWLLVSKFTRKKYQRQFSTIFSQWKNIKQIQTYIDKQSQNWHQPYIISNPYYYTNRYKTFIYEMSNKQ